MYDFEELFLHRYLEEEAMRKKGLFYVDWELEIGLKS